MCSSAKWRRITVVTVEKAAVNAVIAGCRPEYLPVLLAAVECACDPDFNLATDAPKARARSHSSRAKRRTASPITRAVPRARSPGRSDGRWAGLWNSKHFPLYSHTTLVVGPEHARTFADDGWSPADLARHLHETVRRPYPELLPDETHGEGTNLQFAKTPPAPDAMVPKFPSPDESMSSWPAAPPAASRWRFPAGWELGTARARSLGS